MESAQDYWTAHALLEWQVEMGADEAILDAPLNRYELVDEKPAAKVSPLGNATPPPIPVKAKVDPVAIAKTAAKSAQTLESLSGAMRSFEHCELQKGARNFVFGDGAANANVMIIGEAPNRDDDQHGKPFAGPVGELFDKMIGAIGLSRSHPDPAASVYVTTVLPWRPPANRVPEDAELAMMLPFLTRHIELVDPAIIVLMGNSPCQALLGKTGISRLRGQWTSVLGKPVLPMAHPEQLMKNPAAKRDAWADLLDLKARLSNL